MKSQKITRVLKIGIACVVAICLTVFSFLIVYMGDQSTKTIHQVGGFYMKGMCEQISIHFETLIEMNLDQVSALVKTTPPDSSMSQQELKQLLEQNSMTCGFSDLALMSSDGQFEMIYGEGLQIVDPPPFLKSLNSNEKKVALGLDNKGNNVILIGVSSEYPMADGKNSTALVAAFPVDRITEALSLNVNGAKVYSFIIRFDGSFVVRTVEKDRDNYFDRVMDLYEETEGITPEEYLEELKQAIKEERPYSGVMKNNGVRLHLSCTKLPYSEWYLMTFMPYGVLDQTIDDFGFKWVFIAVASCSIILVALLILFLVYMRMAWWQLREIENARLEAERANRAKSEFLSNMSHDIRTPMNAIVGMTAIASANLNDTQQIQNCLKKITLSSKHLLGLINDVLDMSKIENGKMTLNMDQVSLREVIDGIVSIVQPQIKEKNQQFDLSVHDIFAENVCCDSVRLNQVILNLLSNAVKFTPEGGAVRLDIYEEQSDLGNEYVRIRLCVEDNGVGMTPEFKEIIFEAFAREDNTRIHRTEGTGLGMAITKYIVDAMGGTIEVESTQNVGSKFFVTLDLRKAEVLEEDMVLPNWNMLVVDDDRHLCEGAVASLKSFGINAEWTPDGETAIEMMTERHQRQDDYQIILMDWKLPGIGGIETARQIRQCLGGEVPILLISAYDWGEIEKEARLAGVTGFISKPLFKSTLFHSLKQFADNSNSVSSLPEEDQNFAQKRVLLAEDNELNWEIAHDLLSELGLTLEWAENGQICLDKFANSPEGYYDAILMDIRMPVMNGYEATKAIRSLQRKDAVTIPIIAMTADAFAEDVRKCLESGMNAHIAKPIDVREISRLLARYM